MIFRLLLVWLFILIVVVLACCIGVTAYLSKSIIAPLKKMSGAMEHLTEGDLSYEFTCSGDREIKEVYDSIENLRVRLKKSVDEEIVTCRALNASDLVEANEKGELKGKLKEIAAGLNEESNSVIMLIKRKK